MSAYRSIEHRAWLAAFNLVCDHFGIGKDERALIYALLPRGEGVRWLDHEAVRCYRVIAGTL